MSNTMTISARVFEEPQLRFAPSGTAVAKIRVVDNKRKFNKETQQWENDGDGLWIDVIAWKNLGESGADKIAKGDLIVATGELIQKDWETKDGQKRVTLELHATDIAVSVRSKKPVAAVSGGSQSAELPW